ncbi:MAG: pitrilysin family protein [Vicinamibacterales bacterium]|nr:pitrilysin family protein [Vicinamibacterales bacterium]
MMRPAGLSPVRHVLSNGTVVTIKEAHGVPAVAIHALVHAGSVLDGPDRAGLAHFLSRTIDRGTATRSADDIARSLDSRGVTLSVTINRHALSLTCQCLAEDAAAVLPLVGDLLRSATYPDAQVERLRAEILTTIRQDEENPAVMAGEGLLRLLYPGHPYAARPRGSATSLRGITPGDLRGFHRDHITPGECSLAIVGDVDPAEAREAAERALEEWTGGPRAGAQFPPVTTPDARQRLVVPMPGKPQADIAYGFTTILRSDPTYYACWVMEVILGRYALGGRLGDRIRERDGMAYYVFSALDANVVPGPLVIRAGVNPANVDRAVTAIDEELARFAAEGPTEQEVDDTKRYLIGSMPRTLETNAKIANFLQTSEFFGLGLDYDRRLPALLASVTREQVHDAARRWLDPSRAAVAIAGAYEG